MASIINLENLPQLVMDKITSLLNHKQLLKLEQVSRKLKCAVDAHFSFCDHLIIGPLPEIMTVAGYSEATATEKKCLDGLLQIIKRCGIRLRIIQITPIDGSCSPAESLFNYKIYFKYIFASAEVSESCPNLENIIAFPNLDSPITHYSLFRQRNVMLNAADTKFYANNIKISKGETCKLRSSVIHRLETQVIESILNLYSNIEQIALHGSNENIFKFLPTLIENGLKDLYFSYPINLENVKRFCNIGKDLRTIRFTFNVSNNNIADLNQLQLHKNVELKLNLSHDLAENFFAQLSENVSNYIIFFEASPRIDCSSITKLKNLQECWIRSLGQLKVLTEGSFPELKRIYDGNTMCNCNRVAKTCDLQKFLSQILTNKGNQLTYIRITCAYCIPVEVAWKALKHCTAAKTIEFAHLVISSALSITDEDVKDVCHLPNLQHFLFSIYQRIEEDDNCSPLRELMESGVKGHIHFQFAYKSDHDDSWRIKHLFTLHRIF